MTRKLTHEEFLNKFYEKNKHAQDIELLEDYRGSQTKILCKCKICGHEWLVRPRNLLNGQGCFNCVKNAKTWTREQFMEKFYKHNKHAQDIEILGTYINKRTKILCKCKVCGQEWEVLPINLLNGTGCPKCAIDARTKTAKEFINRLNQINPNIEILGTYVNSQTKILCKCKIDGYEWETTPANLLQGTGCPKCSGTEKLTHEEFITELYKINPNIEVLGTYINRTTKIKCKCKIDGYEWLVKPFNLLHGRGCPKCGGSLKLTHEEFINRLKQVNPNIEVLGTYINSDTKINCKCKIDGYIWEARPYSLLKGYGCPKCSISRGEKRIAEYLDNLDIVYIYDKPYFKDLVGVGGGLLRPDFIIPSLKIWVEFDGEQHFNPTNFTGTMSEQQLQEQYKYIQENDQIKNQYAKDNNWTLIRIPYTEYDNIEQILAAYIEREQVI